MGSRGAREAEGREASGRGIESGWRTDGVVGDDSGEADEAGEAPEAMEAVRRGGIGVDLVGEERATRAWACVHALEALRPQLDAIERDVRERAAAEERDRATATVTPVADPPASSTPTADEAERTTRVAFRDSKGTKVRT